MKLFGTRPSAGTERSSPARVDRLHIGCGTEAIAGWINVDNKALPGVDRVLDVTAGLPFENVAAIYAEHFIEHLSFDQGLAFLAECRRALSADGVLRLSTPNLDWVYATHYRLDGATPAEQSFIDCLVLNRAFHGWGHQFLYNRGTLSAVLRASGFASVRFHRYGESDVDALRGLERHRTWEDTPELPHVIIAEATGRAAPVELPANLMAEFREAIAAR
jgi:predicted SAM-dependent methyltransferase